MYGYVTARVYQIHRASFPDRPVYVVADNELARCLIEDGLTQLNKEMRLDQLDLQFIESLRSQQLGRSDAFYSTLGQIILEGISSYLGIRKEAKITGNSGLLLNVQNDLTLGNIQIRKDYGE